jgi:hypothetical protein
MGRSRNLSCDPQVRVQGHTIVVLYDLVRNFQLSMFLTGVAPPVPCRPPQYFGPRLPENVVLVLEVVGEARGRVIGRSAGRNRPMLSGFQSRL